MVFFFFLSLEMLHNNRSKQISAKRTALLGVQGPKLQAWTLSSYFYDLVRNCAVITSKSSKTYALKPCSAPLMSSRMLEIPHRQPLFFLMDLTSSSQSNSTITCYHPFATTTLEPSLNLASAASADNVNTAALILLIPRSNKAEITVM